MTQRRRALELSTLAAGPGDARRRLLVALGRDQFLAADAPGARDTYLTAIREARDARDIPVLADATLGLFDPNYQGNFSASFVEDRRNWIGLAREALDALESSERQRVVRLTSRLSIQLLREHRLEESEAESREALRVARESGDEGLLLEVLVDRHLQLVPSGELETARGLAVEASALARKLDDRAALLRCQIHLLDCAMMGADAAGVRRQLDRVVSQGDVLGTYQSRKIEIMEAILRGRVPVALALLDRTRAEQQRGGAEFSATVPFLLQQAELLKLRQGYSGLAKGCAEHAKKHPDDLIVRAYLARALAELGDRSQAEGCLDELRDRVSEVRQRRDWQVVLLEAAAASAALGYRKGAEAFALPLRPLAGRFVIWGGGTLCCGPVSLALATFDALLERWDTAETGFESALSQSTHLGARPFVVSGRRTLAWALRRRGSEGDAARACELEAAAEREAAKLGLAPGAFQAALD